MSDSRERYVLELDEPRHTLVLSKSDDAAWRATLSYSEPEPGRLVLLGTVDGRRVRITLRRFDESQYLLTSRGFHWINEVPYNR